MKLIIKYIMDNIKREKLLSISILLTIAICCSVIISSTSLTNGMVKLLRDQTMSEAGYTDIKIITKTKTDPYIGLDQLDKVKDIEYTVGSINRKTIYQSKDNNNILFDMDALSIASVEKLGYFKPLEAKSLDEFRGDKIVIGEEAAAKYNLKVGDKMDFLIYGEEKELTVYAINKNYAKFETSGFNEYAYVPIELLRHDKNDENSVNQIYVKLFDGKSVEQALTEIKDIYPDVYVNNTVSAAEMDRDVNSTKLSFQLIVVVLVIMSLFIIYTISKVLILNRLSVLGTFRSIGASIKNVRSLILTEFLLYGAVGGALGVLLGIGMFYVLNSFIFKLTDIQFTVSMTQIGIAFLVAFVISFVSSFLCIRTINKASIGELITNNLIVPVKSKRVREVLGIIFLILSVALTYMPANMEGLSEMMGMSSLLFVLVGLLMLMPMLAAIFNQVLIFILRPIFKNDSTIALMNLRSDENMNKSVTLLALTIAGLLLVGNIGFSIVNATQGFFDNDISFDIWFTGKSLDSSVVEEVLDIEGVDAAFGSMEYYDAEVMTKDYKVARTLGVDEDKTILQYMDLNIERAEDVDKLLEGNNLLASEFLKSKLNLKEGDKIELKIEDNVCSFQVVGFFDSVLDGGDVVLCSAKELTKHLSSKNFKYIYIRVSSDSSKDAIAQMLKDRYTDFNPTILTTEELSDQQAANSNMLMQIFKVFIAICSVTCMIGIISNTVTSIVARIKSISTMRAIGMSKTQIKNTLLIEALVCGILSSIGAGIGTFLVVKIMPYFFRTVNAPNLTVYFPTNYFILCSGIGIVITVASIVVHVNRAAKVNIVEVIRN